MEEKGVSSSCLIISEGKRERLCPIVFGVSCSFVALGLLPEPKECDEKRSEVKNKMLQLLVWRVQMEEANNEKSIQLHKLEDAQKEIEDLKSLRRDDGKTNEKVFSIYAAQEQCWFNERKKLRQQIGGLMNELKVLEKQNGNFVADLSSKLEESKVFLQSKEKIIEEEEQRYTDLEEKLKL